MERRYVTVEALRVRVEMPWKVVPRVILARGVWLYRRWIRGGVARYEADHGGDWLEVVVPKVR